MKLAAYFLRYGCSLLLGLTTLHQASALEKFHPTTQAVATQQVEFDVFLPLTHRAELDELLRAQHTEGSLQYHKWITPEAFRQRFGPQKEDVVRAIAYLQSYGFTVTRTHGQGIRVRGPVQEIQNVFATTIWNGVGERGGHKMISRGALVMPPALSQIGAHVWHFSPVIRNRVHGSITGQLSAQVLDPENRYSTIGPYWPTDIRQAYEFPSYQALMGKGVNVGVVMSSDVSAQDMALYFGHEGLPVPKIVKRPIFGGARYDPTHNQGTLEATLDVQQVGGMAPGATITLYNIPDLADDSVLAGYINVLEDNEVDIVSSSFGSPEALYTAEYNNGQDFTGIFRVYDSVFKQGNAQGITFVASSGDSGALDTPPPAYVQFEPTTPPTITGYFLPGVESPASSPNMTAVGGTNLVTSYINGSLQSTYVRENAIGDPEAPYDPFGLGNLIGGGYWGSGGGVSQVFAKPDYQKLVQTGSSYRTIPDVSLHMGGCPGSIAYRPCASDRSAVVTVMAGSLYGVIGTSASAPEFAGLLALEEQLTPGRIGNANYQIYKLAQTQFAGTNPVPYFRQGIPGFNGYYQTTRSGYNLVLGNGTVYGKNFIGGSSLPSAGDPGSPSNP